jgi:Putative transposase of IS4/5 family (DUF4096)
VLQALRESEEMRRRRLWWSHFRRHHQAEARRAHVKRRARQAPLVRSPDQAEPIRVLGLPALTDELWEQLRPFLPPQKPWTGRPAVDHRTVVEGIIFVIRTGCSWRDLPARFGPWQTVADRYRRWRLEGKWEPILQCLLQEIPLSSSA